MSIDKAELEAAYEDGWHDGRNTTVVDGDYTHDWITSETKQLIDKKDKTS